MWSKFVAALVVTAIALGIAVGLFGVSSAENQESQPVLAVKIAVQLLGDNQLEVGIDHDGVVLLPDRRRINLTITQRKRWLTSSPVTIQSPVVVPGSTIAAPDGDVPSEDAWAMPGFGTIPVELRVAAWFEADYSIWFALVNDGEHVHPERRRLNHQAITNPDNHNRWLTTSPVEIEVGETPASLLRSFSTQVAVPAGMPHTNHYETLLDVAQSCALESVAAFDGEPDPEPDWSRWPEEEVAPNGYSSFRWKVSSSVRAESSSVDAVWLWRNERLTSYWSGRPATGYLFIVRDVRLPQGATLWAAVFGCATAVDSRTTEIDIDLEAA
ncbi:MAG: hypothetical protein F4X58_13300 [Chloroflexi bacterium]|nr:hypothetical protein [Chloroflexota bacterium]